MPQHNIHMKGSSTTGEGRGGGVMYQRARGGGVLLIEYAMVRDHWSCILRISGRSGGLGLAAEATLH